MGALPDSPTPFLGQAGPGKERQRVMLSLAFSLSLCFGRFGLPGGGECVCFKREKNSDDHLGVNIPISLTTEFPPSVFPRPLCMPSWPPMCLLDMQTGRRSRRVRLLGVSSRKRVEDREEGENGGMIDTKCHKDGLPPAAFPVPTSSSLPPACPPAFALPFLPMHTYSLFIWGGTLPHTPRCCQNPLGWGLGLDRHLPLPIPLLCVVEKLFCVLGFFFPE